MDWTIDFENEDVSDPPGSSLWSISQHKKKVGGELRAHIYLYKEKKFLISSIWQKNGPIIEVGEPTVLPVDCQDAELGQAICSHFLQFSMGPPPSLDRKSRDWEVYSASGAKSVRNFTQNSFVIWAETINTFIQLQVRPYQEEFGSISVLGSTQTNHDDLGKILRKSVDAAQLLHKHNMM